MPSMAASSMSVETQAGLAAAGHADADRVRDEIFRIVEQEAVFRLLFFQVVGTAEIESAELFEVFHIKRPYLLHRRVSSPGKY